MLEAAGGPRRPGAEMGAGVGGLEEAGGGSGAGGREDRPRGRQGARRKKGVEGHARALLRGVRGSRGVHPLQEFPSVV